MINIIYIPIVMGSGGGTGFTGGTFTGPGSSPPISVE